MTCRKAGRRKSLFPAYAGVIPVSVVAFWLDLSFPRLRGGDP